MLPSGIEAPGAQCRDTETATSGGNPDLNVNKGIGYEYMLKNARKLEILGILWEWQLDTKTIDLAHSANFQVFLI